MQPEMHRAADWLHRRGRLEAQLQPGCTGLQPGCRGLQAGTVLIHLISSHLIPSRVHGLTLFIPSLLWLCTLWLYLLCLYLPWIC